MTETIPLGSVVAHCPRSFLGHDTGNAWVTWSIPTPTPVVNPYLWHHIISPHHHQPPSPTTTTTLQHDDNDTTSDEGGTQGGPGGIKTRVGGGPLCSSPKNGIQIYYIIFILTQVLLVNLPCSKCETEGAISFQPPPSRASLTRNARRRGPFPSNPLPSLTWNARWRGPFPSNQPPPLPCSKCKTEGAIFFQQPPSPLLKMQDRPCPDGHTTCLTCGMDTGLGWVPPTWPVPVPAKPIPVYPHEFSNLFHALQVISDASDVLSRYTHVYSSCNYYSNYIKFM